MRAFIRNNSDVPNYTPLTAYGEGNAETWITEQMISSDEEAFNIVHELMLANYISEQDELPEVLTEGFGDFLESAAEFFKKMLKRVMEFFKQVFTYMSSYFLEFDKFLDKNRDRITSAGKIRVEGYKYTLDKDIPVMDPINNIVSEFNKEIDSIEEMELDVLKNKIESYRNGDGLNHIRGVISGTNSPIDSEDYDSELFKLFRNGEDNKITLELSGNDFSGMISEYGELKKNFKKVRKDQANIERLLGTLKSFFEKGHNTRYIDNERKHVVRKIDKNEKGTQYVKNESDIALKDTNKVLHVLNLYYSFRFTQSKDISNLIIKAASAKTSAYKEAVKFYEKVLRKAVFGGDKNDTN